MPHLRDPKTGYCQICHRVELNEMKADKSYNLRIIESKKLFNSWRARDDHQPHQQRQQQQQQQKRHSHENFGSPYSKSELNMKVRSNRSAVGPYDDIEVENRRRDRRPNRQAQEEKSSCKIL